MLDCGNDIAEDFSDGRTQCRKDYNDDDGNKNKNKCVLNQTLTFASKHIYLLVDYIFFIITRLRQIELTDLQRLMSTPFVIAWL